MTLKVIDSEDEDITIRQQKWHICGGCMSI